MGENHGQPSISNSAFQEPRPTWGNVTGHCGLPNSGKDFSFYKEQWVLFQKTMSQPLLFLTLPNNLAQSFGEIGPFWVHSVSQIVEESTEELQMVNRKSQTDNWVFNLSWLCSLHCPNTRTKVCTPQSTENLLRRSINPKLRALGTIVTYKIFSPIYLPSRATLSVMGSHRSPFLCVTKIPCGHLKKE